MKLYLAARFDEREQVRELYRTAQNLGHSITADWTTHDPIARYGEDAELAQTYAQEDLEGVVEAEAFILLTSRQTRGGTGVHTELGVAIARYQLHGKPLVYVVGERNTDSLMYFHPAVNRRADFGTVLEELEGREGGTLSSSGH